MSSSYSTNYFTEKFSLFKHKLIYTHTNYCNFKCEYCNNKNLRHCKTDIYYTPEHINEMFKKTGLDWLIIFAGGEPFSYKNFVRLCKLLTQKFSIVLSSNINSDDFYHFVEEINPQKILIFNASFHPEYIKENFYFEDFIKKVILLQKHRFEVIVSLVSYPPYINNIPNYYSLLKKNGVNKISVLTYRGDYNGKKYPNSYTPSELEVIQNYSIDKSEMLIATCNTNFFGRYCNAGKDFYFMDSEGEVRQCSMINKKFGNILKGTFKAGNQTNLCLCKNCNDCYLGIISITEKKASRLRIFYERVLTKCNS